MASTYLTEDFNIEDSGGHIERLLPADAHIIKWNNPEDEAAFKAMNIIEGREFVKKCYKENRLTLIKVHD